MKSVKSVADSAASGVGLRLEKPTEGWLRLGEPAQEPLDESELSLIWEGQRFPPEALTTVDGRAVEVVNPGRRGGAAGPDFVDAVVRLDGKERRGDVELHVRASAFRGHGHAADPAYSRLALHVVYRADDGPETRLCGGGSAPVAAFAPWLERRGAELAGWLAAPSMWQEPCRGACSRLGEEAVRQALAEAGRARFARKSARVAAEVRALGAEEALWRALLDVLGVGGDREGFRRLATAFPVDLAAGVDDIESALVYVAGLGPSPPEGWLPAPLRPGLRASGRPANQPRRRLAALARLARRAHEQAGIEATKAGGRAEDRPGTVGRPGRWPGRGGPFAAMAIASVQRGNARKAVADWQVRDGRGGPALIGAERAREVLVNAVLPLAAACGLATEAEWLLGSLPATPSYGRTGFLEANLRPGKGRIARTALEQQGLLAMLGEWCSKGGCGRCPLSRPGNQEQ